MRFDQIILEPILSEKSNSMRDGEAKKYVFKVDPRANKPQIKEAIKALFDVKVTSCNIVNVKAKPKTTRTKSGWRRGAISPWKKAIVTLAKGETINAVESN
ncbi:MAG: 50S ribosomal protein L23 [Spirochaetales bacterium]|nr:50S ribosomal protein L23 [Spirochaetales bacterium]